MSGEKLARRRRTLAFALDLVERECAAAGGDEQLVAARRNDGSRLGDRGEGPWRQRSCAAQDEALAVQERKGVWPRIQAPDLVVDLDGRPRPVDDAIVLRDPTP